MLARLRARAEWQFLWTFRRADARLARAWWTVLALRGVLPAAFGIAMGVVVGAVQHGRPLAPSLAVLGVVFVALQVLGPVHTALSANLGDCTADWLHARLTDACAAPPGVRHLEDPRLTGDLTLARDFDLGIMGPPLSIAIDFVAGGLIAIVAGVASALVLAWYRWWAALVVSAAWLATHWLLRESAVWRDRQTPEVRAAQRDADYAYRLAVEPPASKELRLFGLEEWTLDRFVARRTTLYELQQAATRLRERPLVWSLALVVAANALVFWAIASDLSAGTLTLARAVVFAQSAVGASLIAFGGLNWALDGAAAPVGAVMRLGPEMAAAGALESGSRSASGVPASAIRFNNVTFAYPGSPPVLDGFDLTIPAGSSLAIVGQNGAGKTTLAKLLCRFYDPQAGAIEVDGIDLRDFEIGGWRRRIAAVFQDFARFDLSLRENVAPRGGASDDTVRASLAGAGASDVAPLDTILARGYPGGTDLSGGQWQRVALARLLAALEQGAGLVLLDEPTAQLDVRGEAEIFERLLAASRHATTIVISHRFSTVRHADRICVLEHGRVVELGSHDELMALGGRYRTMFELQASRFTEQDEEGRTYERLS